jgi:rhamnogalacturonan endolyase
MGNHQMTVGDMDSDGKDEFCNGASAINDNGTGLFSNGLGHGDALHMSNMDPDRAGMEIWQCQEEPAKYGNYGLNLKDAKTGAVIWGISGGGADVGRCLAIDIDPRHKGYECWGSVGNLYNIKGTQIGTVKPGSTNFAVWWDADLSRELLDGNHIDKWDYLNNATTRILTATDCSSNNSTKSTPAVSGDLIGDWREEVVLRKTDNTALRLFTTTIPATNRLYTLMHDTQYRVAIAWQNSAYNQPPHPSFYLGTDMVAQTKPNVITTAGTATGRVASIEEESVQNTISALVFPNPSNQLFTIRTAGKFTYTISDGKGLPVEFGTGEEECEAGHKLQAGSYIVTITTEKGIAIIKYIKQ